MFDFKPPRFKISLPRGTSTRKRDFQQATNIFNKPIRESVPAARRREVLERDNYRCKYPRCKIRQSGDVKLEIHHKNMLNNDNRISNLQALCATHHRAMHRKYKIVHEKDMTGRRISSRVYKAETAKRIKRERKQNLLGLPQFKPQKFDFDLGID